MTICVWNAMIVGSHARVAHVERSCHRVCDNVCVYVRACLRSRVRGHCVCEGSTGVPAPEATLPHTPFRVTLSSLTF